LTFTIRPGFGWRYVVGIAWSCFVGYQIVLNYQRASHNKLAAVMIALISLSVLLSFIRRERIEIYPDRMVWRATYFGFTHTETAPLSDVLGAEWYEGEREDRRDYGQDYVEFFLPDGSVKACYGLTFDEFDQMRNDIRPMYPDVIRRWGQSTTRSKTLTLLNLS
jgi:hypothetical protein